MGWILRVSAMLFARNWPTTSWVRWPLPTPGPLHERCYRPVGPTRAQWRQQRQQQQRHLGHAPVRTRLAIARQIGNIATVARPAVIITGIMSLPNSSLTSTGVVDTGPHRGCAEGAQRRQREVYLGGGTEASLWSFCRQRRVAMKTVGLEHYVGRDKAGTARRGITLSLAFVKQATDMLAKVTEIASTDMSGPLLRGRAPAQRQDLLAALLQSTL